MIVFTKTDHRVTNAAELMQAVLNGLAVNKTTNRLSVVHFIANGTLYTTDNRGLNEMILAEADCFLLFKEYENLEFYNVEYCPEDIVEGNEEIFFKWKGTEQPLDDTNLVTVYLTSDWSPLIDINPNSINWDQVVRIPIDYKTVGLFKPSGYNKEEDCEVNLPEENI